MLTKQKRTLQEMLDLIKRISKQQKQQKAVNTAGKWRKG